MGIIRYFKNVLRHDRNTRRLLNDISIQNSSLANEVRLSIINQRIEFLKNKTLASTNLGITDEKVFPDKELIVSLTTFGRRINEVYLAIESIMQGSIKPNRIILWLAEDEFKGKRLPTTLINQQKRGLEIKYCEDIKSYKKIIPTLTMYPDAYIVTIDDDLMYEFDLLENLIQAQLGNEEDICACRMHKITLNDQKRPNSYLQWDLQVYPKQNDKSSLHFLTSGGGTLFPPHCFNDEVLNKEAFMSLCPKADDIWINAMLLLSGKSITKAYTHSRFGDDFIEIRKEQDDALSNENMNPSNCLNDIQFRAICDKYDLYKYWI